ncbi:MAG TPA: DUF5678 domain-containing protein [Dehalococcoidia bacterium]
MSKRVNGATPPDKASLNEPTPQQIERAFWEQHRAELKAKYPDQFVAISRATGAVVAVAPDFTSALQAAKRAGYQQTEIWCRGMRTPPTLVHV